jgi:hypothetical protein
MGTCNLKSYSTSQPGLSQHFNHMSLNEQQNSFTMLVDDKRLRKFLNAQKTNTWHKNEVLVREVDVN